MHFAGTTRLVALAVFVTAAALGFRVTREVGSTETGARPGAQVTAQRPDPVLAAWIDILVVSFADRDPTIRDSACEALRALGQAAVAALERLAALADAETAWAARKLIGQIERRDPSGSAGARNRDPHGVVPGDRGGGFDRSEPPPPSGSPPAAIPHILRVQLAPLRAAGVPSRPAARTSGGRS